MAEQVVVRFDDVTFKYDDKKIILDKTDFNVREDSKVTIMGQNGAGKSTIFKLITGELKPTSGQIHIKLNSKIAIAEQMIPEEKLDLSILDYFKSAFEETVHGIEGEIKKVFYTVNLDLPLDKKVRELSGGQKARLLLAYALIQKPDILLLDEPTNNLDDEGIAHLTTFLIMYDKTCLVISHDTDFLNTFTDGVLNLDVHTHKVEQFVGNYYDVLNQIERHIENQRLENARIEKSIRDRFEKVNKLGGKSVAMRQLATKVREKIEVDRENMVETRREDKAIPDFVIPAQHCIGTIVKIDQVSIMKNHEVTKKNVDIELLRGERLYISGPNGIGKSTLLKAILSNNGARIGDNVRVGYYSQDFSELDFEQTAFDSLKSVSISGNDQTVYAAAGRFMLPGSILHNKVRSLSEGQKGLLCYARFMLQEPGLLIMDEPTNHINFRHLPVIAKALDEFKGTMIFISHVPDFVKQIRVVKELDLGKL